MSCATLSELFSSSSTCAAVQQQSAWVAQDATVDGAHDAGTSAHLKTPPRALAMPSRIANACLSHGFTLLSHFVLLNRLILLPVL